MSKLFECWWINNPGKPCLDILQWTKTASLGNREYWVKLDNELIKVYCDMKIDEGIIFRMFLSEETLSSFQRRRNLGLQIKTATLCLFIGGTSGHR